MVSTNSIGKHLSQSKRFNESGGSSAPEIVVIIIIIIIIIIITKTTIIKIITIKFKMMIIVTSHFYR